MAASLSWTDESGRRQRRQVGARPVTIGRGANNDIVIDDPMASRRHATLTARGGVVEVDARESRNGIRTANGRAMSARVRDGGSFRIGGVSFHVTSEAPGAAGPRSRLTLLAGIGGVVIVLAAVGGALAVALTGGGGPPKSDSVTEAISNRDEDALLAAVAADPSDDVARNLARQVLAAFPPGSTIERVEDDRAGTSDEGEIRRITYKVVAPGQPVSRVTYNVVIAEENGRPVVRALVPVFGASP